MIIPAALFAGMLREQSLKGNDPYLADQDGFGSLFINLLGISGDTQIFSFAVDGVIRGCLENNKFLRDKIDTMMSRGTAGSDAADDGGDR